MKKKSTINEDIVYHTGLVPSVDQVISVLDSSRIVRPTGEPDRIAAMIRESNLLVTAWDGALLVGLSRALTDYCYCCYLSDLAVRKEYQRQGIGKKLVEITRDKAGELCTLILIAAPAAVDYYPKIGMERLDRCFVLPRMR
jgi:GNAT superfamily N-acetyltransferase